MFTRQKGASFQRLKKDELIPALNRKDKRRKALPSGVFNLKNLSKGKFQNHKQGSKYGNNHHEFKSYIL